MTMIRRWPGFLLIVVLLVSVGDRVGAEVDRPGLDAEGQHDRDSRGRKSIGGGALLQSLGPTLWRIGVGFGLATLVAVPLGLLMGSIAIRLSPVRADHRIRPADPEFGLHPGRDPVPRHRQRDEDFRGLSRLPVSDPAEHL